MAEFNSDSFKVNKKIWGSCTIEGIEYAKINEPDLNTDNRHKVVYQVLAIDKDNNVVLLAWDVTEWWYGPAYTGAWDGDWEKEVFIVEKVAPHWSLALEGPK